MSRARLIIDVERCEDCNNCMLACKDEHVDNTWPGYAAPQPRHGHRWIDVQRRERGSFPLVDVVYLPVTCMQCDTAPCIEAGAGAVRRREDGIVLIDPILARGRREILASCPYGAIWWNDEEDLPQKCTFCAHLLDAGWKEPRCVQACPTGALSVVQAEPGDLQARVARGELRVLHPDLGTAPRVYYRNLHRWTSFRLAGTVTRGGGAAAGTGPGAAAARQARGLVECADGAWVVLRRDGVTIAETFADPFGDYAFDGLEASPQAYVVAASLVGYWSAEVVVDLRGSASAPPLHLTRSAN